MKRILTSFIFLGFLILSQMQLVHALDMGAMSMNSDHLMTAMKASIFCETSTSKDESGCNQEILPYTVLPSHDPKENIQEITPIIFNKPFSLQDFWNPVLVSVHIFHPPDSVFQRTKYTNLIGIVKSLD